MILAENKARSRTAQGEVIGRGPKCKDFTSEYIKLLSYGAYPLIKCNSNRLRQEIERTVFRFDLKGGKKICIASLITSQQVFSQGLDAFDWNRLILDGLQLKIISETWCHTLIKCCKTNEGKCAGSSHFWHVLIMQCHVASHLIYHHLLWALSSPLVGKRSVLKGKQVQTRAECICRFDRGD